MNQEYQRPLECLLESVCSDSANFPDPTINYYQRYCNITDDLKTKVYKNINAGLAALSNESGLYTDHSEDHFDTVVLHAGILLGLSRNSDVTDIATNAVANKWILSPYEIYILLLSIRLHDVGNIYGREGHEKNIRQVLQRHKIVHLSEDKIEASLISAIAGAHGGKTNEGDKDTIGNLAEQSAINAHISDINNKKLAAITRFADEVCENRQRVSFSSYQDIPEHNLVFHRFAGAIVGNSVKNRFLNLYFQFPIGHLKASYQVYNDDGELVDISLPEVILGRLKKTELERRYCNRFIPDEAQINGISVAIEVIEDEQDEESFKNEVIEQMTFTLEEKGYPLKEGVILDSRMLNFMSYERLCKVSSKEHE